MWWCLYFNPGSIASHFTDEATLGHYEYDGEEKNSTPLPETEVWLCSMYPVTTPLSCQTV